MKIALVFIAVLGLACSASIELPQPRASRTLLDDWIEFVTLIPRGPIINILVTYLATDAETQANILHLVSPEVKANIAELDREVDFLNYINYLEEHNLAGTYDALNVINSFFGWGVIVPDLPRDGGAVASQAVGDMFKLSMMDIISHVQTARGDSKAFMDMWAAISAIWPTDEVRAFHEEKLRTSPEYYQLFADLGSNESRILVNKLVKLPSWQRGVADVASSGIDTDKMTAWIRRVFGWED